MERETEAEEVGVGVVRVGSVEAVVEGGLGVMPTYWTATCWRSNWGFLGLTARTTTRTTARQRRRRKEKRRKSQQQQPFKEAEEEEEYRGGGG